MLRKNRVYRRQIYRTGSSFRLGPTAVRYLIMILVAVFSLLYFFQSAQAGDRTIELRRLEEEQQSLDKELNTLQMNASRLQSLKSLNEAATAQGLVPVGAINGSIEINQPAQ